MGIMTASQLVDFVLKAWEEKWGYVLTGQGELYTKELAEEWIKSPDHYPHAGWNGTKREYFAGDNGCKRWFGHRVADCSGLIVAAFRSVCPRYGDRVADTFRAQFVQSGKIRTILEIPGLAVWRKGHIGIYIGNGYVIEARGYTYGVVRTMISEQNWSRWTEWGKLRDVDYEEGGESIMQKGEKGTHVRSWQDALQLWGRENSLDLLPKYGSDGDFGGETQNGTKIFQKAMGLKQTGIVDAATYGKMLDYLTKRQGQGSQAQVENLEATIKAMKTKMASASAKLAEVQKDLSQ